MKIKLVLINLIFVFGFSSCYYDNEEELYPKNGCNIQNVTYSKEVNAIIGKNCAVSGCHVANAIPPNLSDFNNLKNSVERVRVRAIIDKTMPPSGKLNECDTKKLDEWIKAGSLNN
jgi:hypothetical protein